LKKIPIWLYLKEFRFRWGVGGNYDDAATVTRQAAQDIRLMPKSMATVREFLASCPGSWVESQTDVIRSDRRRILCNFWDEIQHFSQGYLFNNSALIEDFG